MGGDTIPPSGSDTGEDSSVDQQSFQFSSPLLSDDDLSMKVEDGAVDTQHGLVFGELHSVGGRSSSASLDFETNQRRQNAYSKILQSNEESWMRSKDLEEAKSKILSYTPGAWIGSVGAKKLRDYDVPKTTSLLLVGPKGSGKSSLINRISKMFEDDKFASERAQVSYNSSIGEGTLFLQEYMIPRGSTSFCLYDTRSLSDDSSENKKMLKRWMKKGVHHGKLVTRRSDGRSLRIAMNCKARDNGCVSSEIRKVNFVIFVVNGPSVLKSLESDEDAETRYTQTIASAFNCPYLAFKDDKPLVVVTHGDLLSHAERARVLVHLGELLGIPPATQIFDIPECNDPVSELTIVDMLRYSLEHADKNLPHKRKDHTMSLLPYMLLFILLGIAIIIQPFAIMNQGHDHRAPWPQAHDHHVPSPQAHDHHVPSPEAHDHHVPSPEGHDHHVPSPEGHDHHVPSPEGHDHHVPSPEALDHHGPPPEAHDHHGPPPEAHDHHGPPPEVLDHHGPPPEAHDHHGPPPEEHDHHGPLPQAHDHHGPSPQAHDHHCPLPQAHDHHCPLLQAHDHHCPLLQAHDHHVPSPQAHDHHVPSPEGHDHHVSSPEALDHHGPPPEAHDHHGPPPEAHDYHGPPPEAHDHHGPPPEEYDHHGPLPQAHDHHGPSPQAHDHHCLLPQAHDHHCPLPQAHDHHCPLLQAHDQHGPLPEPDSVTDWSKMRHLWLDTKPDWVTDWSKIRHLLDTKPDWVTDWSKVRHLLDTKPDSVTDWSKIRHLLLDTKPDWVIDWSKIRHLWLDD